MNPFSELHPSKTKYPQNDLIYDENKNIIYISTMSNDEERGIVEYDVKNDKIKKVHKYPNGLVAVGHSMTRYGNKLLLVDGYSTKAIWSFDMNTKTFEKVTKLNEIGHGCSCLVHDDLLHIIGGSKNDKHIVFNINTKSMQSEKDESAKGMTAEFGLVLYKKKLFKMGGYDLSNKRFVSSVFRSSPLDETKNGLCLKWTEVPSFKLPTILRSFGYVQYKQWVIIFGGQEGKNQFRDEIYYLDLEKSDGWQLCSVKCPLLSE